MGIIPSIVINPAAGDIAGVRIRAGGTPSGCTLTMLACILRVIDAPAPTQRAGRHEPGPGTGMIGAAIGALQCRTGHV